MLNPDIVREATRLTRSGQLVEATALLQRMLRGETAPAADAAGPAKPPRLEPPTIDATATRVAEREHQRARARGSIKRNRIALKGPVTTPIAEGFTSVNVGLRKALDLYANLRPVSNLAGVPSRFQDVDLVSVRENTTLGIAFQMPANSRGTPESAGSSSAVSQ